MSPKLQNQIAKSKRAGARRLRLQEGRDRRDARLDCRRSATITSTTALTRSIWGHVGTLGYYAEMLKRVTDSAFKEGECAE